MIVMTIDDFAAKIQSAANDGCYLEASELCFRWLRQDAAEYGDSGRFIKELLDITERMLK